MKAITAWLEHPLTRGRDLDDPETSARRRQIIREKRFLERVYLEWYERIREAIPSGPGDVIELGSGGGFLREIVPTAITSDVMPLPGVDMVLTADHMPFGDASLKAIVMTNVFHHIPDVRAFLREATRTARAGARVVMIEPWNSGWSRLVYSRLHHEPFEPGARDWTLRSGGGPLSAANGALPWIVFERDRDALAREFPDWTVASVTPMMPLAYLLSGGVSLRLQAPPISYDLVRRLEALLPHRWCAMFARIVLTRT